MSAPVVVSPYDEAWPGLYEVEAERVRAALPGLLRRIEHVGSTAVPGQAAKPIVDIQVSVEGRTAMQEAIDALEQIGYRHEPIDGFEEYPFLGWPSEQPRVFHLHLCLAGSSNERRHLAVRDLLRRDPQEREAYGRFKLELAARCEQRQDYVDGKDAYMAALERRALTGAPPH
jgi:GrpB-like predicted nucleotidyltransferase (UPF0157 family)